MSGTDAAALPSGGGRVLMMSAVVLAAAGAVVLALGTHDARLLRLGLVAALWAALLGAFAVSRMRRESSSCSDRADQLRTVYQLELEREVTARREYTRTVELELREQAELSQRREIGELRAELAAMRVNLEQVLGGYLPPERVALRAASTRLPPLPTQPRTFDDSHGRSPTAAVAAVKATPSRTGPELRFGPSRPQTPMWGSAPSPADQEISHGRGRHGDNGSHHNGGGLQPSAAVPPAAQAQRTVNDLLAANGVVSLPRRRRSHEHPPASA